MKLYFAVAGKGKDEDAVLSSNHKHILCSYHYYKKYLDHLQNIQSEGVDLFIDSGAFSVKNGVEISLSEYSKFVTSLDPPIYATLDVIGNAEATLVNTAKMESEGLRPLPVFHMGENIKVLWKMITKYDYIALGGLVFSPNREPWLDRVWAFIMRNKPALKVHGFGLTDQDLMMKYPWYSVDSSSYASGTRFARVPLWNDARKCIQDISAAEFFKQRGVAFLPGQEITGEIRAAIIREACLGFVNLVNYVTEIHRKRDFGYLTSQMDIFDIIDDDAKK